MLTPVDVQNKTFKGGIGFDKKDVEAFMKELSSDYEQLYRLNVELKDKVATLTESLQHYRSTEDSMQKALTLSEKTAEETIIAANDKARQINNEAAKKAEALLADAKQELLETKDEIHRLQQLHAKFKAQYTKILQGQLQLIENKVVDIDLGEGYDIDSFHDSGFGVGSSLGGGLGSLGDGGGYTGASSFDDRFERTNQESSFNHGSLNTDPFADAANGGGRFSSQTGKGFTGGSSSKKSTSKNTSSSGDGKSSLNVKNANAGSTKVRKNFSTSGQAKPASESAQVPYKTEPAAEKAKKESTTAPHVSKAESTATASTAAPHVTAASDSPTNAASARPVTPQPVKPSVTPTSVSQSKPETEIPVKPAPASQSVKADLHKENVIAGEVEEKLDESTLIGNDDDDSEGFSFMDDNTSMDYADNEESDAVSGEVEEKLDESTLIGNDDDDDEGFSFMDDSSEAASTIEPNHSTFTEKFTSNHSAAADSSFDDDVISGEVEDKVDESMMLESEDNYDEGFSFMDDEDSHISSNEPDTIAFSSNSLEPEDDDVAYAGEVEDKVNEATMLESEDNFDEGFNFVVGNDTEEEIPTISSGPSLNIDLDSFSRDTESDDDVLVGDVEEPINQSNLIGNADDDSEGFDFL